MLILRISPPTGNTFWLKLVAMYSVLSFSIASFTANATVSSYGEEPACLSVVPLRFVNHASRPARPSDANDELNVKGSDPSVDSRAPPPTTVKLSTALPDKPFATFTGISTYAFSPGSIALPSVQVTTVVPVHVSPKNLPSDPLINSSAPSIASTPCGSVFVRTAPSPDAEPTLVT